ncbi:hypothetical protein F2Q69_00039005 [Brassica cretica]|uniref:SAM domain-containing protein n=1 Tax=Brassica cretica TaxID=69181 RepID=A0A8S9SNY2_BRACR|nr:hypothetical protein F2Q69_00039005 [Brassica cretica]
MIVSELYWDCCVEETMSRDHPPEPLDFFIWTVEDVGSWLEEINLGSYRLVFKENGVNGEYLESMSVFTTEQILHFIRRHHMKWGDFITLCKELRRIKVACLKGEQRVRRPWWAPSCLSVVFVKAAKRNRQSRVVEVDDDPAESKKDDQDDQTERKKKTKKVVERYWDWELTNETQPIWLRNSKEVTTEEYNEFYRKTFNEYLDPLASSHFTTEGEVEFKSILYVPPVPPMGKDDVVNQKTKNIRLYVKRVFISDDFDGELFPRYLSFIKGVVDSHDLPLNVSREILQESRIVRIMKKRLVKKAFDMILGISLSENREDYEKFWDNFGKHLKLGCIEDRENHKRLAPLLRFFSSQSENDMISLDEYVENMKAEQKAIYYIASDSVTSAKNAPFLEKLMEKELEVLYLVEPIDEVAIQSLKSYKDKDFIDISKEDLDLGKRQERGERGGCEKEDVGSWLEEINLGSYRLIFKENGVNGEYLESMSVFTTEQILHFIRRHHMKWGDFITLCKELRRIKVACLKGEQRVRRPWWAPSCLSVVFVKAAKRNRQSRVVSLKLES